LRAPLAENVALNLREKHAQAFPLSVDDVRRRVIDYERFKLDTFLSSGVFPKRYFGYFDGRGDTREREARLRELTRESVALINAHLARVGAPIRLSHAEVAVTFLAEGGALLLLDAHREVRRIHPVRGIGLDDVTIGFSEHLELVRAIDTRFGTQLSRTVMRLPTPFGRMRLIRYDFTFDEAVLGTALMYTYEKTLAARKLLQRDGVRLEALPFDEQLIHGSLVYNSGVLFSAERVTELRDFATAKYLLATNIRNAHQRPTLPVSSAAEATARFASRAGYPEQPTSWNAVYHVLQRYGAYVALRRFDDVFDERGMFRE
jgi:hypothetical protein